MNKKIPYTQPSIGEREVELAMDAARNGWGEHCYDYIHQFEDAFSEYLGVDHTIATSSCTGALHMGLSALGIGPGDEVIMADTNWIASAAPITYLGAKPVFVDVLADTWCIDPEKIEAAISDKTKAILAVHLYGNVCDMDAIFAIANKHHLPVIEDAAEAIGSAYHGQRAGSMGLFSTFSFHGTKTITTGEGGMFATKDKDLYDKVLTLSNHGRAKTQSKQFWPDMIGFKYKMSNIQAALGCAQMERIDALIKEKRDIFLYYHRRLSQYAGISMNPEKDNTVNGYWMPTILFDKHLDIHRDELLSAFAKANIDARVFFWPLSALDMFADKKSNKVAWDICHRAINLPSSFGMSKADMDKVCEVVIAKLKAV